MPKAPILDRTVFYDRLRDRSIRLLDWNLVNTNLGQMVEFRNMARFYGGQTRLTQIDETDMSFDRLLPFDEDSFFATFLTGGQQLPSDFNTL